MGQRHGTADDVHVEAEQIEIKDASIAGDCVFAGPMLITGELVIASNVRFQEAVMVAPGARVIINGRTWVPKQPKPKDEA